MLQIIGINLAHPMIRNTNNVVGFAVTVLNIQRYKLRFLEKKVLHFLSNKNSKELTGFVIPIFVIAYG